jgi:succinoglycan biosynthesis transport protein ExoP
VLGLAGIIKLPSDMTPEEQVLKSYYHRLSVFQVKKSRVIAIEFESQDPQLAAQAANAVAETYLRFQQTVKQDQNRASGEWLSREIERLRANVAQAEAKVEQYRAKSSLFLGNNNTTLSNQQLGEAKPLERFAILAPNAVLKIWKKMPLPRSCASVCSRQGLPM